MFPSRDLSASGEKRRTVPWRDSISVLFVLYALTVNAGQFVTSDFSAVSDSNSVLVFPSYIKLYPYDTLYVALLDDEILTDNTVDSSYGAEVINLVGDTFCFFWGEYNGSFHRGYRRRILLAEFGATELTPEIIYNSSDELLQFIHAARGTTPQDIVSSFYTNLNTHASIASDSVNFSSKPNASLCHVSNDTFCIVYKESNLRLQMRKVRLSGSSVAFADGDIPSLILITNGLGPAGNFSNSSVAADSSGNVFITLTRGGTLNAKNLEYFLTNTDYDNNGTGTIANNISLDVNGVIDYADAPVVSYADGKFAVVYWTSAGIYLYDVTVSGTPPAVTATNVTQIVAGNTYRASTVATNGRKLFVAWKNLSTNSIEGKVYKLNNGTITMAPTPVTKTYSNITTSVGDHGPELNVEINEKDDIALAWKQDNMAVGSLWGARGIMNPDGYLISAVESVTVEAGDSLVYLPGACDTTLQGGAVTCSLQVGPSSNPAVGWTSWMAIGDSVVLDQNTVGMNPYFRFKVNLSRNPTDTIKSPLFNEITVRWNVKPRLTSLDSIKVNGILVSGFTGFNDTLDIISHTDTLDCYCLIHDGDTNDTLFAEAPWKILPELAKDTLAPGSTNRVARIRLAADTVWDTVYTHTVRAYDAHRWYAVSKCFTVRARKAAPVITQVIFNDTVIPDSGLASIVIGKPSSVTVSVERSAIVTWNPLTFQFRTLNFDTSFTTDDSLNFKPSSDDVMMWVIVSDAYGARDTSLIRFNYPEYATDTVNNPGYLPAVNKLADSLSFILGKDSSDTVCLPAKNIGNDTLTIDSIFFSGSSAAWLHLGVPQDTGIVFFDSLTVGTSITRISILPDSSKSLVYHIDAAGLTGDKVVYDTVFIFLNDPLYPIDTIPVKLEYNDLPLLTGFSITYKAGTPYWETLQKKRKAEHRYVFPPHARLQLTFSESIDSVSAVGNTFAYSILEFIHTGTIDTIPYRHIWSDNYTTLQLAPCYTIPSEYFNGLLPPNGAYIPTDTIAVKLISNLHDKATTPSGPNYLDLNNDFVNDSGLDTTFNLRVDPIHFTLDSVYPASSAQGVLPDDSIVLYFSSPIFNSTVDTVSVNNKSLLVTTKYNSHIDSTKQVVFKQVYIDGSKAVFKPGKNFFYGDSVYCYYRGVCARDSLGYSIDMSQDGIPIGFFDSSSTEDDYFWSFKVEDIDNDSVIPDSGVTGVSCTTPITLIFSKPLFPGTIDTALTDNRSLLVTSRYSEGTRLGFSKVEVNGNRAVFYLNQRLFYADSVHCTFTGLLTKDTTLFSVDMGTDTILSTGKGRSWFFSVEELALVSVSPDSASNSAGIHASLAMTFNGPISPKIFDTTTTVADSNRSFYITSGYSGGSRLAIAQITFSSDSNTVIIIPAKAFYSYDSIYCNFAGFVKNYSYLKDLSLVPNDTSEVINAYSWYFLTKSAGFYTFPNPFKPGSNRRHREMGGIWFKNLHAIKKLGAMNVVKIKVFNINTHPVFESGYIRFQQNNADMKPEWFWDTKNNRGVPIASGVYFYAIYDVNDKVLLKGKLLLVR